MLFKNLLLVNAILFVPFGIGFVFLPSTLLSLYGVNPESGTIVAAQLYGGLLIAIGLLSWLSREVTDVSALRAIQISFMIAFPINTIVHALGTMSGAMNALGWSAVIIYLLLSVGYTYFYFTTTKEQVV